MEEAELNRSGFWEGDEPLVLVNPALNEPAGAVEAFLRARDDLSGHVVFRTSGSSGVAKYGCLSREALLASARAVNRRLQAQAGDRWIRALPFFHVGGFGLYARARAAGQRPVAVLEGEWDARRFASRCDEEEATLTSLVPAQVIDLCRQQVVAPGRLRAVVVGGGTLPLETGSEARRLGWPVLQSYGLTEAGSQVATQGVDALEAAFSNSGLPVLDHWEVRSGEGGVLELKGEALLTAYLDPGGVEGEAMRLRDPKRDGWFRTADRVLLEEGPALRLTFREREDDSVKVLGELVSLRSVRERLEKALGGRNRAGEEDAVLVAVLDERKGAALVLVCAESASQDRVEGLVETVNAGVPGYERIAGVRVIPRIPRTALGKVDYGAVTAMVDAIGG